MARYRRRLGWTTARPSVISIVYGELAAVKLYRLLTIGQKPTTARWHIGHRASCDCWPGRQDPGHEIPARPADPNAFVVEEHKEIDLFCRP